MGTATDPEAPPARPARPALRRPAPGRVRKRKLTLAEAADQWEAASREAARQRALLEESAQILLAYFERTGRSCYKDRIALILGGGSLVLDQAKVRAFLGERLHEFQKRTAQSRSLRLLK